MKAFTAWFLASAIASGAPAWAQDVPEWARDHTERWYAAFNAGDAAALVDLYAPDAVLLLQGQAFQGRDAIRAFHAGNFEGARFACTWTIAGTNTVDNLTAVWGADSCVETPKSGGATTSWTGRWMTVYQAQPDGSRTIVRDSGEEDRPRRTADERQAVWRPHDAR